MKGGLREIYHKHMSFELDDYKPDNTYTMVHTNSSGKRAFIDYTQSGHPKKITGPNFTIEYSYEKDVPISTNKDLYISKKRCDRTEYDRSYRPKIFKLEDGTDIHIEWGEDGKYKASPGPRKKEDKKLFFKEMEAIMKQYIPPHEVADYHNLTKEEQESAEPKQEVSQENANIAAGKEV